MDCVIIRLVDLPFPIKGATVKDAEGDYNIYINARLSEDERVKTYWHEIEHIRLGHFYDERPVAIKEAEAEKEASTCYSSRKKRSL
jgi:hypothetical protein